MKSSNIPILVWWWFAIRKTTIFSIIAALALMLLPFYIAVFFIHIAVFFADKWRDFLSSRMDLLIKNTKIESEHLKEKYKKAANDV